jgi:hypothetical protein
MDGAAKGQQMNDLTDIVQVDGSVFREKLTTPR